jgi:hypothetical protein
MKPGKIIAAISALLLLCMVIAGCAAGNTTPADATSTSAPPTPTTPTITPVYGEPGTTKSLEGYGDKLWAIKISPSQLWVDPASESRFTVTAIYEDGRQFDVTGDCVFRPWGDDCAARVITREVPGENAGDPPVTGWFVVAGQTGDDTIIASYTKKGVTLSTSLVITIGKKPLAEKPQPKL